MTRVSVITGGAGGMGLATAKVVGRDHTVVLCDVRQDRLDAATAALTDVGIAHTVVNSDVRDRQAVTGLFEIASSLGPVKSVIHAAGVSPSMGDAEYVMRTNAVGTVNVNEVFYDTAAEGAAIVNVASMAAHMLPEEIIPTNQFPVALQDEDIFMTAMLTACEIAPEEARSGIAYAVSKSFVRWYSTSQAERFNGRGLRIVSVSPGSIDTEMGRLEEQAGAGAMVADAAVPRWGTPEEMAELFAFCASDKAGYLTGTDILNDGGVIASMRERARVAAARRPSPGNSVVPTGVGSA
ncbi:SDR family oxidoreductase [Mycobacterium hubeiense]|uniref:SDR family oxidoreductase n=1 Tax=Mycobacterium hubeiense TaxID=1867256 RepID=UPI000C7F5A2E|nr:SDR family oxidoreductase [Mycobacterium sp. QGD 101]